MTPIESLFSELGQSGRKAFMPFVTAGDPDLDFTGQVIEGLRQVGCDLCEVGIPYSDPIADGPVIQASYTRALDQGVSVDAILSKLSTVSNPDKMPLITMISFAIVHRIGVDKYLERAKAAGIAGAIIPDLLVEEAEKIGPRFHAQGFDLIQLITPTTSRDRALRIAASSSGFVYYVSVTGITGERTALPETLVDNVGWLKERIELPLCIGFGISQPEHVRTVAPVCDGVIVGSALVRRIAEAGSLPRDQVLTDVTGFAAELKAALD